MAYFRDIFFANMGGGGGQNYFHKMGLFSAFSHYVFNDCEAQIVVFIVISPFPHFNTVKIVIFPSKFWLLVKKWILAKMLCFELKKCTVSGLKRQFDKWHLFRAPTGLRYLCVRTLERWLRSVPPLALVLLDVVPLARGFYLGKVGINSSLYLKHVLHSRICLLRPQEAFMNFTWSRFVMGEHWTGSPNKSIDQIGKNCPKMSENCVSGPSGQFLDIFRTFFGQFSDILSTARFFWAVQRFARYKSRSSLKNLQTQLGTPPILIACALSVPKCSVPETLAFAF